MQQAVDKRKATLAKKKAAKVAAAPAAEGSPGTGGGQDEKPKAFGTA